MGHSVTIGGERLGSGKRMKAYLHGYERSTHNKSYKWRSSMACGTLVPFLVEVALPGDTFDIKLNAHVLTHPTIGPLFGDYKLEADLFLAPVRLYQGDLHMNQVELGLKMNTVMLPQLEIRTNGIDPTKPIDNQQINGSSLLSYLGIRGVGYAEAGYGDSPVRKFNAVPYLSYFEIYKQYYSNKQEQIGAIIHKNPNEPAIVIASASILDGNPSPIVLDITGAPVSPYPTCAMEEWSRIVINTTGLSAGVQVEDLVLYVEEYESGGIPTPKVVPVTEYFTDWEINVTANTIIGTNTTLLGQVFRGYGSIVTTGGR